MVPNLSKGAGIKGTALYVLHDVRDEGERAIGAALAPEQQSTHRVGWTHTRNLSTDDPELAWRLMCATAKSQAALKQAAGIRAGGRPSKYQCGHIALSWEHQTKPDAAEMQRASEGALKALGWDQLQALIVEHKDHDHSHVHIVVNLVDPETGRNAPNSKNEYERLQRWAHEYDKARRLEVCPQRAKRMEPAPDEPTPPAAPTKRWLSRQEYEAIRNAERAEFRAQAMDRYREAAATVKAEFAPAWRELYASQKAELKELGQAHRALLRELSQAARIRTTREADAGQKGWIGPAVSVRDRMAEFVNKHRDAIWPGIDETNRPGNQQTLMQPAFVKRALERAQMTERSEVVERHRTAKTILQGHHTEARQEAYRQAWKRPEPAPVVPLDTKVGKHDRTGIGIAAALAASAAGIAAYAMARQQRAPGEKSRDPERDLAGAADRIRRQQTRVANANDVARVLKSEEPAAASLSADKPVKRDEVTILRERIERERKERQVRRDPERAFDRQPSRSRD